MEGIEEGDAVTHTKLNGGLKMTVEEIKDDKALFTIDGEKHWIPVEELKFVEKTEGGFRSEGDSMS